MKLLSCEVLRHSRCAVKIFGYRDKNTFFKCILMQKYAFLEVFSGILPQYFCIVILPIHLGYEQTGVEG